MSLVCSDAVKTAECQDSFWLIQKIVRIQTYFLFLFSFKNICYYKVAGSNKNKSYLAFIIIKIPLFQNVFTGRHKGCGHDSSLDISNDLAHTGIKLFLETNSEFHPQASGSIVKATPEIENDIRPQVKTRTSTDGDNDEVGDSSAGGFDPLIPGLTTTPLEPHHHYSAEELSMAVATSCVCALVVGFITGFLMSRRCSCSSRDDDNPYHVPYLNQLVQFTHLLGCSPYPTINSEFHFMVYYELNNQLQPVLIFMCFFSKQSDWLKNL